MKNHLQAPGPNSPVVGGGCKQGVVRADAEVRDLCRVPAAGALQQPGLGRPHLHLHITRWMSQITHSSGNAVPSNRACLPSCMTLQGQQTEPP